jgi:hypothetical protein
VLGVDKVTEAVGPEGHEQLHAAVVESVIGEDLADLFVVDDRFDVVIALEQERKTQNGEFAAVGGELGGVDKSHVDRAHTDAVEQFGLVAERAAVVDFDLHGAVGVLFHKLCELFAALVVHGFGVAVMAELENDRFGGSRLAGLGGLFRSGGVRRAAASSHQGQGHYHGQKDRKGLFHCEALLFLSCRFYLFPVLSGGMPRDYSGIYLW